MLNKCFTKILNRDSINHENLTAKAQSRIWSDQKGARLQENLTVLSNQAAVASLERAERNPNVANVKGATRWLKFRNHFQWGSTLNLWEFIRKPSTNGFIRDGLK